jgi:hypothetical protein
LGEGNKKNIKMALTPLLPPWEKGLGDEGNFCKYQNLFSNYSQNL